MRIRRYEPQDADAIVRLNQRLAAGGANDFVYPEASEQAAKPYRQRLFVAVDGDEIRGGAWLEERLFRASGADTWCGWLKYPVAESLVNPQFSGVPGGLLLQLLREQPRLMGLGLGGHETPLAKMLSRLKWTGATVPFMALLVRPRRALPQLEPLKRSRSRLIAAHLLGASGAAWLGQRLLSTVRGIQGARVPRGYTAERVPMFGDWTDELWIRHRDAYGFLAPRDARMLNSMLPVRSPDTMTLRVRRNGSDVGWACVVRHDFSVGAPDRNFGRSTVAVLADMLADPSDAPGVVSAALDATIDSGVDLVFTNQLHPAWARACYDRGFIEGPSNFAFYAAPGAQALISAAGDGRVHINRGDCDGPMWYAPRGHEELGDHA